MYVCIFHDRCLYHGMVFYFFLIEVDIQVRLIYTWNLTIEERKFLRRFFFLSSTRNRGVADFSVLPQIGMKEKQQQKKKTDHGPS